ncbi:CHAP domain-containing protein [Nocardioides zhouii]|uniref:CHAP domain-containing protein n=1 Tax=Nocardioides zhouii TaxID=1168729 RepID=A0A4Q2T3I5_9ACTN|nr:CHAP domain-containing protein [Nocardioides zhouii]RYC12493.1 CHAP domain-containing protein [Nocardioides zhouii]
MGNTGLVARALAAVCIAGGLLGVVAPAAQASDDYPWAWQGQCPIVPQAPIVEPTPPPTPTPTPAPPKPGEPPAPVEPPAPPPPPPPPVFDPVTGHTYDPRGPRPTCASRVWSINGSIGDSWGFVLRNCTSFAAWRLRERGGVAFSNSYLGQHWGDARAWDEAARAVGIRVDDVPAIGAVAQSDEGRAGHVAWVSAIGPGTVTIEEYNHSVPGGYGSRTVPVGDFRYLHVGDVAPSPLLGSDRPIVSVPDRLGESSTARVDDRGTLWLSRPGRPLRVAGPRRTFSPLAAPALALDRSGMPWLAATTRDGRVLAGRLREGRLRLRDVGASAPTASPSLALTRSGRPVLATVSSTGTLTTRRFAVSGRWSRPVRVGRPSSWATHTAPVLGADSDGRTWIVAVGRAGTTYAKPLESGRLVRLRGATGSITSTPALTVAGGTTYLHQVGADGRLGVRTLDDRRWTRPELLDGEWSPYASPAVGELSGRLHVAVVDVSGRVVVRAAVPGQRARVSVDLRAEHDPTRSPGLVTRHNAGMFVVAGQARARLLTRPASALAGVSSQTRAGFTP